MSRAAQSPDEEVEEGARLGCGSKMEATRCTDRLEERAIKCTCGEYSQGEALSKVVGTDLGRPPRPGPGP